VKRCLQQWRAEFQTTTSWLGFRLSLSIAATDLANPPVYRGFNFTLDTFCYHKCRELIGLMARQGMNS